MKGRHLKLYENCIKTGKLPPAKYLHDGEIYHLRIGNGLCYCDEIDKELLEFLNPTPQDLINLSLDGLCSVYWASGLPSDIEKLTERAEAFTPLRQTVVLFMAAMNGEL